MARAERRVLLMLILAMLSGGPTASATLTLTHGRVIFDPNPRVTVTEVEGVAALDLGGTVTINHYFDCETSEGTFSDLVWEKESGQNRFPTMPFNNQLRLNLAPDDGEEPVDYPDLDIYTCRNTVTGETASLNITGGSIAVCPVEATYDITLDGSISLEVYTAGNPVIRSDEIEWFNPQGTRITSGGRFSLLNGNKRLLIQGVQLEDGGTFRVDVVRQVTTTRFNTVTSTTDLDVHVEVSLVSSPADVMATEHTRVVLTCSFRGNPRPMIVWEREGDQLPVITRRTITPSVQMNDTFRIFTVTSELAIPSVLLEDQGRYRCMASSELDGNVLWTATSSYATLTVEPGLELGAVSPTVIETNGLIRTTDGSDIQINCIGSGVLLWESSSRVAIPVETTLTPAVDLYQTNDFLNNRQTLFIRDFSAADTATYTCRSNLTNINSDPISESVYITSSSIVAYIAEMTVYALQGSDVLITAIVFTSSTPTVQWYYEGSLITSDNSRYTILPRDGNMYNLSVLNVDSDVLGAYEVVVIEGQRNESDSVQLSFPEPPSSTVIPTSVSINESMSTHFQCVARGTDVTATWQFEGGLELPNGVVQEGTNLLIVSATRNQAGRYECVVRSSSGTAISTATLTVMYPPTVTITREETGQVSIDNTLSVIAEDGNPAPTFSCSSDGVPSPVLSWSKGSGSGSLPGRVVVTTSPNRRNLEWNRDLIFTDSGQYQCTASNQVGTSVAILDLLVRRSPSVTSILPNSPVTSVSSSSFSVPPGYSGTVLTCVALGWPTPSIQWLHNGEQLNGTVTSDAITTPDSPSVSARLIWSEGFVESDAGEYTCVVGANDTDMTQSRTLSLLSDDMTSPPPVVTECSVGSSEAHFQLRVLETDCLMWSLELKEHIAENLRTELVNIVGALCPEECAITNGEVMILDIPACSNQTQGAAVFRGRIATDETARTESIFCALSDWQRNGPILQINNNLHLVDTTCLFESSSSSSECSMSSSSSVPSLLILIVACVGGVIVLLVVSVLVFCLCCCWLKQKKGTFRPNRSSNNGVGPRSTTPSSYERTFRDPRYTDRINPEHNEYSIPPGDGDDTDNPLYSTLNRDEMASYPPPPVFTHPRQNSEELEMNMFRKNSRSRLLSTTTDGVESPLTPNTSFSIVQNNGLPQPYQMAVSSTDNLDKVGTTEPPLGGSGGYSSNTHHHQSAVAHGLKGGSMSGLSNPLHLGDYEIIDKRYGVNEFSSSSPKLRAIPATRVASAGQVRPPAAPPPLFRKHLSAIEDPTDEDYSQLDRSLPVRGGGGVTPPRGGGVNGLIGGKRGKSASALLVSTSSSASTVPHHAPSFSHGMEHRPPHQHLTEQQLRQHHHQHHQATRHPEKRTSVTNYSRSTMPSSPTDSNESESFAMKNMRTFTPSDEAPPPYSKVPVLSSESLHSPSESSSMLENGAYEGVQASQQEGGSVTPGGNVGVVGGDDTNLPWYHNSDFSVHMNGPRDSAELGNITPYSQVSNYEIDQRRNEEEGGVQRGTPPVPRFSISHGNNEAAPAPYTVPVLRSSVESLSKVNGNLLHSDV